MAGQLRAYRRQIRSVQATKKITRAMELIAASRIIKAQAAVRASTPYAEALTRAVSAAAENATLDHPLITEKPSVRRAALVLFTSDRGLAGAYSSSVLKDGERYNETLREQGKTALPYLVGRKAAAFYRFRRREVSAEWSGFTDKPAFENAREIAERLVADFLRDESEGGVDEIHVVYTHFVNMVTQEPRRVRLLPLEVTETAEGLTPLYSFEPSAEAVLDQLLPQYVTSRVYNFMLQAAASELAARQRAMKSATDNAEELVRTLTRLANNARQSEITQEITEIVGGADALASAGSAS